MLPPALTWELDECVRERGRLESVCASRLAHIVGQCFSKRKCAHAALLHVRMLTLKTLLASQKHYSHSVRLLITFDKLLLFLNVPKEY